MTEMTNCNYSEHTKMQRKEIQKQIEELQAKLEELENQKSLLEIAFKDNYGVYPDELKSNDDFNCWVSFKRGYIAAKKEKVSEYQPSMINCILEGNPPDGYVTWNEWYNELGSKGILHNLRISSTEHKKVEEVKKLQEKNWYVDAKTLLKSNWEPKPQEPEEVAEGLKKAFREAVKQGVVSSTKPQTLYDVIADWWDEIFTNGNPSGQNIESLVEQIEKWLPAANEGFVDGEYSVGWNDGFNDYRIQLMEKLK